MGWQSTDTCRTGLKGWFNRYRMLVGGSNLKECFDLVSAKPKMNLHSKHDMINGLREIIEKRKLFFMASIAAIGILCLLPGHTDAEKGKKVSVAAFGAIPDDGQNDAGPLRKAMDYCRSNPGITLYFPSGIYNFSDRKAIELMDGILTGKVRGNPQDSIFRPYYPYVKGLDFNGLQDIQIEAPGAVLLCEGYMEPVSLNHCTNIRISGMTIDYNPRPHLEGEITETGENWYIARFDHIYPLSVHMPLCRIQYYDHRAHRLLSREDYFPKFELVSPQVLKIYSKLKEGMAGNKVMIPLTFHFRPAILMLEARNIELDDVTIHSQPGMGIVGHRSENVLMKGLRIVPEAGHILSTNTDATHFTSCKGLIRYLNCDFEGHGDDAVNIHNYYLTIRKPAEGDGYNLLLEGADWHAQVLDYPDVGDTMELVRRTTLEVVKRVVVKTVHPDIPGLYTHVTFGESLPADIENYDVINVTRLPRVEITGCSVVSNRARGFLIKSRNVLIEHNLIRESTGTGIHVGAEGSWHEGPASENVVIRYNRIIRCGTGAGTIAGTCGIAVHVGAPDATVPGLHKHILIEGNVIEGELTNGELTGGVSVEGGQVPKGISVSGADDVIIRYNEVTGCKTPLDIRFSENVRVYSNTGIAD